MIDRLRDFLAEVREGLGDGDTVGQIQAWLESAQENIVALTIVFCFVIMTGSCVALPVIGVMQAGSSKESRVTQPERKPASPWALEDGQGTVR